MESSKRVKLSLRVTKEKKPIASQTQTHVSDCIQNEAEKHEFEVLETSFKPINDKLKQSCSSQSHHNSETISRPSRNVCQRLMTSATWTPLPEFEWNESDNSVQMIKENQARRTHDSFSNENSQIPDTEWIPLPMPCLRCLCGRSPGSTFTQRATGKSDSALIMTSTLVHNSESDIRKVDSTLPDVLSKPETSLSVNTKSIAAGTPSVCTQSKENILQTPGSHLSARRELEVENKQELGIECSKKLTFHQDDQQPNSSNSGILQKSHSQLSARPAFTPKAKSILMMHEPSKTNMQITTSMPSGQQHVTINKISSHSAPKPLSTPNPPDWYGKHVGSSSHEHRGLGSHASISNTDEAPSAKGQGSNSTLSLQQCPLCGVQFEISLGQIERDSHIAACLSTAEEDVVW